MAGTACAPLPIAVAPSGAASKASPKTTPQPAGLIWYHLDFAPSPALVGVDWSGHVARRLALDDVIQSADGTRLWYGYSQANQDGSLFDGDGKRQGGIPADPFALWSDDGTGLCSLTDLSNTNGATAKTTLVMLQADRPPRPLAHLGYLARTDVATGLIACSGITGRALLADEKIVYTPSEAIDSLELISLHGGSLLFRQHYSVPLTAAVASHDGAYVAEQGPGTNGSQQLTSIRSLPSGRVVGQLAAVSVLGFSWDASLVVVTTAAPETTRELQLIDWRTQHVVWRECLCLISAQLSVIAQPGGSAIAILKAGETTSQQDVETDLIIVGSDGSSRRLKNEGVGATAAF